MDDRTVICVIEWKECTIGEIAAVKGGKRLPKGVNLTTERNSHPYIRIRDLTTKKLELKSSYEYVDDETQKNISRYIVDSGDILISIVGTIGLIAIVGDSLDGANLTENCVKLIDVSDDVDKEFLYYFLISSIGQEEIKKGTVGAVQPKLPIKNIQSIKMLLPPITVQKQISGILSALDRKIELNNAINENLEQQAQAMFRAWFMNFEHGDHIIGEYIIPIRGKGLLSKNTIIGDVPVVAGGLEPATYHNVANTKSPVITISASGANAGFVRLWNIPVWSSDSSYIDDSITTNVYFWYVMLKLRQKEIFEAQTGSAQPHIYPKHIAELTISELNEMEITKYNELVKPLFVKIGNNQIENQRLAALRDTLLPKLMNGEIDVSAVQI